MDVLSEKVLKTVKDHNMLKKGDKVICAVSGGADSVCLLSVMLGLRERYGLTVCAAHLNHMIRGGEAERDAEFVRALCEKERVRLFYERADIPKLAREKGLGEEECGREVRYDFFERSARALGGAKIATGHNLDDNAETVIFRLARGSAAGGLSGIKYVREAIIRPLLDAPRSEIAGYLRARGLAWQEDSTNQSRDYTRNMIRRDIMPLLREISPQAHSRIVSAARLIAEDEDFLKKAAERAVHRIKGEDGKIDLEKLASLHMSVRRRAAATILKKWGCAELSASLIENFLALAEKPSGKRLKIAGETWAVREYGKLALLKDGKQDAGFCFPLAVERRVCFGDWEIGAKIVDKPPVKTDNEKAVFDLDKIKAPLFVRSRKEGDRIRPKGMEGTKKVKELFIDRKVARFGRGQIPMVLAGADIIFIPKLAKSRLFAPDEKTENYLLIEYTDRRVQ